MTYAFIAGESETRIWGLTGRERLQRMLRAFRQCNLARDVAEIPEGKPVVILRADHVFDARVLSGLMKAERDCLLLSDAGLPVAMRVSGGVPAALADFVKGEIAQFHANLPRYTVKDLNLLNLRQNLKKRDQPYVFPVSAANRRTLESELYVRSYKGVTDLVTKWLWPVPAYWAVRFCVRAGLSPNHVTLLSLVFAVWAGVAFWQGHYGLGLVMAWLMTFLDTVDGKLARVTVTSSRMGDVLDHGLDIIHPPLWYIAWAAGLPEVPEWMPGMPVLIALILAGYIGGRLCEGAFQFWVASFDIFIWRPVDSYSRLVTARRNPNLILLTAGWLAGRPDIGLMAVVVWHLISTGFLALRVLMGWQASRSNGPLRSWFEELRPGRDDGKLAARIFAPVMVKAHDRKVADR
jgi:phosphatidylglycerophosphate synthase